ncbi:MAG TPA: Flp family type IVb pilin [Roseiarcus sp.]|jgi:pilus assembly protein Flp/PilA|nr:Flp family type IVb pilin [Roseiarcus sp.]
MWTLCRDFSDDISGATAVEYAIIAGLIFLVIIASVTAVGTQLTNVFSEVATNIH